MKSLLKTGDKMNILIIDLKQLTTFSKIVKGIIHINYKSYLEKKSYLPANLYSIIISPQLMHALLHFFNYIV